MTPGHPLHLPVAPPPATPSASAGEITLAGVVAELCSTDDGLARPPARGRYHGLPSRDAVASLLRDLLSVLFPGYVGTTSELNAEALPFHVGATLDRVVRMLVGQVRRAYCFGCATPGPAGCDDCEGRADAVTRTFLGRLPAVRRLVAGDVHAAYEGDPAATSPAETILSYPGVLAVACQRLGHELYQLEVPLVPRMITEHAHALTGIDIHPGARIGERFFIDHGTGVVIGETAVIGNGVRLYQGVTLGARSFPLDEHGNPVKGVPRHPVVEDDVTIYSGATILGRITVGAGSVIGGNVWLTHSVPAGSRVSQGEVRQARFSDGAGI